MSGPAPYWSSFEHDIALSAGSKYMQSNPENGKNIDADRVNLKGLAADVALTFVGGKLVDGVKYFIPNSGQGSAGKKLFEAAAYEGMMWATGNCVGEGGMMLTHGKCM